MKYSFREIDEVKVQVLDHTGKLRNYIKSQLAAYRARWGNSIASNLVVVSDPADLVPGPVIVAEYHTSKLPSSLINPVIPVNSLSNMTHYHLRRAVLDTQVKYTKDPEEAKLWLSQLPKVFAYDCETTKKQGLEDIPKVKMALDVHRNEYTMHSFAHLEDEAFVISDEPETHQIVLDFLTETESTVVMHNASFDMKMLRYNTGKFCKSFDDTQIMWRTITNHTQTNQALTGLKHLAKRVYAEWAVAKDEFNNVITYTDEVVEYNNFSSRML